MNPFNVIEFALQFLENDIEGDSHFGNDYKIKDIVNAREELTKVLQITTYAIADEFGKERFGGLLDLNDSYLNILEAKIDEFLNWGESSNE